MIEIDAKNDKKMMQKNDLKKNAKKKCSLIEVFPSVIVVLPGIEPGSRP